MPAGTEAAAPQRPESQAPSLVLGALAFVTFAVALPLGLGRLHLPVNLRDIMTVYARKP